MSYTDIGSQYRKSFEEEVRKAKFLKKKVGDEGWRVMVSKIYHYFKKSQNPSKN